MKKNPEVSGSDEVSLKTNFRFSLKLVQSQHNNNETIALRIVMFTQCRYAQVGNLNGQ